MDDNIELAAEPEGTVVVDVRSNKTSLESCTTVPTGDYVSCTGASEGLRWAFACKYLRLGVEQGKDLDGVLSTPA